MKRRSRVWFWGALAVGALIAFGPYVIYLLTGE